MKLREGMSVIRNPANRGEWWVDQCRKAKRDPGGVFVIDEVDSDGDPIFLCLNGGAWSASSFDLFALKDRPLEEYM